MLAAQLGRTVAELLAGMSSAEFDLWMSFHSEGGFGEERADWRVAIGSAAVCQVLGSKVRADQLLPKFGRKEPTPLAKVRAWLLNDLQPERFWPS